MKHTTSPNVNDVDSHQHPRDDHTPSFRVLTPMLSNGSHRRRSTPPAPMTTTLPASVD
ncbi:hypothetical protein SCLCIDRAFT_1214959 [Scleroderma citrinum Foug A]|uniref:Uncharacterized protein n=1 Tax=Scleroderma citrinum Foug A TaxID=1036808 RepID=A0A0C2ZM52_9AGAM|nr:hypothetical protein SCLCIDRAFT_1214959 [Scleroderma citrinum Foug A]